MRNPWSWLRDRFNGLAAHDILVIGCIVGIKGALLARYGLYSWSDNDGVGYVALAEQLRHVQTWISVPDIDKTFLPISLLRLPGYPLLILAAQILAGSFWQQALVALQLVVSAAATFVFHRTIVRLTRVWPIGLAAAVVFSLSYQGVYDRYVLTDSLYVSLAVVVVCAFVLWIAGRRAPSRVEAIAAGLALGAMTLLRDANLLFLVGLVPLLALLGGTPGWRVGRVRRLIMLCAPAVSVVFLIVFWNFARIGEPVFTTGAQTSLLLTMVKVEQAGTRVFDGETPLDRLARRDLRSYEFSEVTQIGQDLFREQGLTAPTQARLMTERYLRAWKEHPRAFVDNALRNAHEFQFTLVSPFVYPVLRGVPQYLYAGCTETLTLFLVLAILPLMAIAAVLAPSTRRDVALAFALNFLIVAVIAGFAAIHVEYRYFLPLVAPIMTAFCLALRSGAAVVIEIVMPAWRGWHAARLPHRVGMRMAEADAEDAQIDTTPH